MPKYWTSAISRLALVLSLTIGFLSVAACGGSTHTPDQIAQHNRNCRSNMDNTRPLIHSSFFSAYDTINLNPTPPPGTPGPKFAEVWNDQMYIDQFRAFYDACITNLIWWDDWLDTDSKQTEQQREAADNTATAAYLENRPFLVLADHYHFDVFLTPPHVDLGDYGSFFRGDGDGNAYLQSQIAQVANGMESLVTLMLRHPSVVGWYLPWEFSTGNVADRAAVLYTTCINYYAHQIESQYPELQSRHMQFMISPFVNDGDLSVWQDDLNELEAVPKVD